MTKLTQYSEAFWGGDFTSCAGYDALAHHNKEQKKFLQDFEEYLRKRSKIEHEYCKSLAQLSKCLTPVRENTGLGVLEQAWIHVVSEVENNRKSHEKAAQFLAKHADDVKRLCREQTARRETIEDKVKQFHSQKTAQFKTVNSFLKTYGQKCRDHDMQTDSYNMLTREVTRPPRELEKAKAKMDKSEDEANKADVAYKNAVQLLDERRRDWEREMELACKEFQERDEEQIRFVRSELWLTMNALSQVSYEVDEGCERVRAVLETCDVSEDIQHFIQIYSTGSQKPAPVLYQNYYDNSSGASRSSPAMCRSSSSSLPGKSSRSDQQDVIADDTYSTAEPPTY